MPGGKRACIRMVAAVVGVHAQLRACMCACTRSYAHACVDAQRLAHARVDAQTRVEARMLSRCLPYVHAHGCDMASLHRCIAAWLHGCSDAWLRGYNWMCTSANKRAHAPTHIDTPMPTCACACAQRHRCVATSLHRCTDALMHAYARSYGIGCTQGYAVRA